MSENLERDSVKASNPMATSSTHLEFGDFFKFRREKSTPNSSDHGHTIWYWLQHWGVAFAAGVASGLAVEAIVRYFWPHLPKNPCV